jgi:hypothetical protein
VRGKVYRLIIGFLKNSRRLKIQVHPHKTVAAGGLSESPSRIYPSSHPGSHKSRKIVMIVESTEFEPSPNDSGSSTRDSTHDELYAETLEDTVSTRSTEVLYQLIWGKERHKILPDTCSVS